MADRPPIPTELRRGVLLEAGHRCAIHTCRHTDVEVHHIEPWSRCKEHRFENLIALCPNCHTLVQAGKIDRKSLRICKSRLAASFRFQTGLSDAQEINQGWATKLLEEENAGSPTYTISAEYPCFGIAPQKTAEEVNAVVRGVFFQEVLSFRSAVLCTVPSMLHAEFLPHCTFSGSFEVALMKPQVLSLRFVFTSFTGGAYSNTSFRSLNFQLEPETSLIDLYCLFKDSHHGLKLLSEFCVQELCGCLKLEEPFDRLPSGAEPSVDNYKNFNIHRHGISIDFDEHRLGGKAIGAPSVLVPYSVIWAEMSPLCAVYNLT